MNGPRKMYRTRQIIRYDNPIDVPNCMYKMKNMLSVHKIQSSDHVLPAEKLDIREQKLEMHPEMADLQIRQENILKQLAELKDQMMNLKETLKITSNTNFTGSTTSTVSKEVEETVDLVINASPSHPPYSLVVLQKLWTKNLRLIIQTHLHSTVINSSRIAQEFIEQIKNDDTNLSLPRLLIRLIWKDVEGNMELITSSLNLPIFGEVNILRYLSRIGPSNWNYEILSNATEIDSVLDVCYLLARSRTKTERSGLLVNLNARLGKSNFLCSRNEPSIADIAASSAIKQVMNPDDINVNLTKWFQRCEQCH